ncbi:MAG TPA: metallophosphoesterase, partial [Ktedonobacterales bacterium]|nr:metallophosphoesterase [Ktedonobacterales bacterium]
MPDQTQPPAAASAKCVEHHPWTPLPVPPPRRLGAFTLRLRDVDAKEHDRVRAAGALTFHMVGCSGAFTDHEPQRHVARALVAQLHARAPKPDGTAPSAASNGAANSAPPAGRPSFLYHLGDITYKDDNAADELGSVQRTMYREQFFEPFADYNRPIFAVAGNHDGKVTDDPRTCAIDHFLAQFCAGGGKRDRQPAGPRPPMAQPYPYWRLTTPLAYVIGLYSNIHNGGVLDDPATMDRPQYHWLVEQLADVKRRNAARKQPRAVLLAVHYPPYSGAANFTQRGDPTLGPSGAGAEQTLGSVLQQAFAESGQRPDAVFSAHAHLYQRLSYRHADGWEVPYLIAGSGGHGPVESLWEACSGAKVASKKPPFNAVLPPGLALGKDERLRVMAYDDQRFGFLRVSVTPGAVWGEFFTVRH